MIVCHCNVIHCHEIRQSVADMRTRDAHCLVTPGLVFKNFGKRPNCGNCMPLFASVLEEAVVLHGGHRPQKVKTRILDASSWSGLEIANSPCSPSSVPGENAYLKHSEHQNNEGSCDEGKYEGYRSAKQGAAS